MKPLEGLVQQSLRHRWLVLGPQGDAAGSAAVAGCATLADATGSTAVTTDTRSTSLPNAAGSTALVDAMPLLSMPCCSC